jgi:GGDEF domain-containing protein
MILLRSCRLGFAERLAGDLRQRLAGARFGQGLRVTVSIAVSAHRRGESIDALLARTERTLHLAKQFGGDRVEIARSPAPRMRRAEPIPIGSLRA